MMTAYEKSAMTKGLLFGIFAGGAVATAIALLYAPMKGSELRGEIRERGKKLAHDLEHATERAKARTTEVVKDTRRKIGEREEKFVGAVKAGVDAFKDMRHHA